MYQQILVPVDGSATSQRALAEAIRLATLTGGRLRVMHVLDDASLGFAMDAYAGQPGAWLDELRAAGNRLLDNAKAAARQAGVEAHTVLCDSFSRNVGELVSEEARAWPADLIVVGTHGRRGVGRLVMGSGAEYIARSAPVPVLLVHSADAPAA